MLNRSFAKGMRLALACAAALALAACGPKEESKSVPAKEAAGAPGKPTGKLTIGLSSLGSTERYLPWLEAGREGWLVLEPIYESLLMADPRTGAYVPQLAEKFEVDPSGKTWRFTLRKGVQFHDGQGELTAEDVAYSYEMYLSDKSVASNKPILQRIVERLEIVGPHELVFHLKAPDVTFAGRLSNGQFGVVSKKYMQAVGETEAMAKPVGTGPFRLVQHRRSESVSLEAVVPHWRQTPGFAQLVLRRVPDQSARLAMLRGGEVDVTEIPFKLKREAEAAGLQFLRGQGAAIYHVQLGGQLLPTRETFDPSVPWVGDPGDPAAQERALKVRKALNLAVDKQAIIDAVFEGEGVPGVAPFFGPGTKFVPADLKPYPYDPVEAKKLLAEAGYARGFSRDIEMLIMPWPGRAEMADVSEAVAGFWERNLGLKIRRRPMDFNTYAQNVGAPKKSPWVAWAHGYTPRPVAEPIAGMETWLTSSARYNSAVESPVIDALSDQIRAAVDPDKRVEAYRAMAAEFHKNWFAVPIASVPSLYAYEPKVIKDWPMQPGEAYISGYEYAVPAR